MWQRKGEILSVLIMIILVSGCGNNDDSQATSGEKQLYTCGMHPQVVQDEPGNCPICGMKLTPLRRDKAKEAPQAHASHEKAGQDQPATDNGERKILYWRAPMDPTYISDKPGKSPMGMDLIPVYEGQDESMTITIDPTTVQNMGVRTAPVERRSFHKLIRTVGHVDYDEDLLFSVTLKFDGWIEELMVSRTGETVSKGQPLFSVYSPQLVATQEEYLLAHQHAQKLSTSKIEQAKASASDLLKATRQRLSYWDISEADIERLEQTREVRKSLTIYSPAKGIIEQKQATEGAYYQAGQELFRIADLSKIWVLAHIFEYELPWISVGQQVKMKLPYVPGQEFEGRIDYIYPYLNPQTRDVKVRMIFRNSEGTLKPEMYANLEIEASSGKEELVVPSEAVIRSGTRTLVFLSQGEGRFLPKEVVLGPEGENGLVMVKSGLQEGQQVVTSAQFLLDSESRLREALEKMMAQKEDSPASGEQPHSEMQQR